ncbi:F-box protein [Criblamydia sequanensis]|uniref:F-box and WD repeat-containing protein n=1 Tax=Candidatus Criblamydia sequanensis CRIB-18 TaxID=1437425 RepID=A0A090CYF0_9BACT|nr:F-box protein [Criblamydia sequanensis]CDR33552.1 F-box and WD repeat-containing protein [Criblamydia sequanensis CRIB-18]
MQLTPCNSNQKVVSNLKPEETGDEVPEINFFDLIPEELVLLLAQYLDARAIGNLRLVCRKFNVIGSDASLIPTLFKTRFPILAGFYSREELNEEHYKKAILRTDNIRDTAFTPRQTVLREGYDFQGHISALVCRDNLLYGSCYKDGGVTVWDLEGNEKGHFFQFNPIPHHIGLSNNYIFGHSNATPSQTADYTGLQRISLLDQAYTFWNYPKANFWRFKVFDESIYAESSKGILEIDVESGLFNEYISVFPTEPFFADQYQVLGIGGFYITSWDRETLKEKESLPLIGHLPDRNLHLDIPTYHPETNLVFLARDYTSFASYDLRQKSIAYKKDIHGISISGIIFFNNQVVTSALDGCLKIWDHRKFSTQTPLRSLQLSFGITAISSNEDFLFIGTQYGDIIKCDFIKEGSLTSLMWDAFEKCLVS